MSPFQHIDKSELLISQQNIVMESSVNKQIKQCVEIGNCPERW